ncbi:MAG: hypothetical protein HUU55_16660 [Myxococcales bacterium]|nr:hypothetical protein [Myxococcales bacterium]
MPPILGFDTTNSPVWDQFVLLPDIGIQIKNPTPGSDGCLSTDSLSSALETLRKAVEKRYPNPDLRAVCGPVEGISGNVQTIGLWAQSTQSPDISAARDRGLLRLELLQPGEHIGISIGAGFIRKEAQAAFAALEHQFDKHGNPDSDGPVHLLALSNVRFVAPDRVVTEAKGFTEQTIPDADFTATVTDILSVTPEGLILTQSIREVDLDQRAIQILATLSWVTGFLPGTLLFAIELYKIRQAETPQAAGSGAVGSAVAAAFPSEILLPFQNPIQPDTGIKLALLYQRVNVTTSGVAAAANFQIVLRKAVVNIVGPSSVRAHGGLLGMARYRITTDDLRGKFKIDWSIEGGVLLTPHAEKTFVRFDAAGIPPGGTVTRLLRVSVTDEDGFTATDELLVTVR